MAGIYESLGATFLWESGVWVANVWDESSATSTSTSTSTATGTATGTATETGTSTSTITATVSAAADLLRFIPNMVTRDIQYASEFDFVNSATYITSRVNNNASVWDRYGNFYLIPPNVPRTLGAEVSNSGSAIQFKLRDEYNTIIHPTRTISGNHFILVTYPEYKKDRTYSASYIAYDNGQYFRRKVAGVAATAFLEDDSLTDNWSLLGSYSPMIGSVIEDSALDRFRFTADMNQSTFTASAVTFTGTSKGEAVFAKITTTTDNADHRLNTIAGTTVNDVNTSATVVISFFFSHPTTTADYFGFVVDLSAGGTTRIGAICDRTEMTAYAMTAGGGARVLGSRVENIAIGLYRVWSSFVLAEGMSDGGNHSFQIYGSDPSGTTLNDTFAFAGTGEVICVGMPQIEEHYYPTTPVWTTGGALGRGSEEEQARWESYFMPDGSASAGMMMIVDFMFYPDNAQDWGIFSGLGTRNGLGWIENLGGQLCFGGDNSTPYYRQDMSRTNIENFGYFWRANCVLHTNTEGKMLYEDRFGVLSTRDETNHGTQTMDNTDIIYLGAGFDPGQGGMIVRNIVIWNGNQGADESAGVTWLRTNHPFITY